MRSKKPYLRIYISIVLFLTVARAGHAVLLAEIGLHQPARLEPPPADPNSLNYAFITGFVVSTNPYKTFGSTFHRQVSAADVGMTFDASPNVLEQMTLVLSMPTAEIGMHMNSSGYGTSLSHLQAGGWAECCEIVTFRKFVTDITKIPVNRITMTVDFYHNEPFLRRAIVGGGHTIRIYGIPEPSSAMIFIAGSLVRIFKRRLRLVHL